MSPAVSDSVLFCSISILCLSANYIIFFPVSGIGLKLAFGIQFRTCHVKTDHRSLALPLLCYLHPFPHPRLIHLCNSAPPVSGTQLVSWLGSVCVRGTHVALLLLWSSAMHSRQAEGGASGGLWLHFFLSKFHTCLEAQCEPSNDPSTMAGSSQVSLLEVSHSLPLPGLVFMSCSSSLCPQC